MSKSVKLLAPEPYVNAPEILKQKIAGGCGPGGFGDFLVPDTIWGLCITPACAIHDWEYHFGLTEEDKQIADDNFRDNMFRMIKAVDGWWLLKMLRRRRAMTYYWFVVNCGGPAFWDGKETEYAEVAA